MKDQKRILLLLDGSEDTRQILHYGEQLWHFKNVHLVLFHVLTGIPECFWDMERIPQTQQAISELMGWEARQEVEMREFTQNARKILISAGFVDNRVDIKIQKRKHGIARDILQEAADGNYAAVQLRRQGERSITGITAGSIATKLFSNLTCCPLLIVGQRTQEKRMLIAIDGSPSSMKAIDFVIQNLEGDHYSVDLVHIIRGIDTMNMQNSASAAVLEVFEHGRSTILELFNEIQEKLITAGFQENHIEEKIISGAHSRAEALINEAKIGQYDTLVIGRKGLSQVADFSMGRVCSKVINSAREFSVWVI